MQHNIHGKLCEDVARTAEVGVTDQVASSAGRWPVLESQKAPWSQLCFTLQGQLGP
jgi:hypothetical protein